MGLRQYMNKLQSFIKSFDLFGAQVQLAIHSSDTLFQSIVGGLSTILIYSASAMYFFYVIYQWKVRALLPVINDQHIPTAQGDYFPITYHFFRFNIFLSGVSDENSKLLRNGFIYNQTAFYYPDYVNFNPTTPNADDYGCGRMDSDAYYFASLCMNLNSTDQNFLYQDQSMNNDSYLMYGIAYCDPSEQIGCIDRHRIQNLSNTSQDNWELTLIKQDINIQTGEIFNYEQSFYFWFSPDSENFLDIQLKVTKAQVTIDDGVIFSNLKQVDIISDITVVTSLDKSFIRNQGPQISVSLDKFNKLISISYPKLTEVLASAISFFQTLIISGFLFNLLNTRTLSRYLLNCLMEIYFPSLKNFSLQKNWNGEIQQLTYKEKQIDTSVQQEIDDFKGKFSKIILSKISIISILSEINKIQIAIHILSDRAIDFNKWQYYPSFEFKFMEAEEMDSRQLLNEDDFLQFAGQRVPQREKLKIQPFQLMEKSFEQKCFSVQNENQSVVFESRRLSERRHTSTIEDKKTLSKTLQSQAHF